MAEECAGNSVIATSSTTPLNWWYLHANSLPSWNNNSDTHNAWNNQANPNSSSSCEEDISVSSTSFTNASNHSSLTVESSRGLVEPTLPSNNDLLAEHASDNQLWTHVLSGVGSNGDLLRSQEIGENFLDVLSSKSMTSAMFEPACDYLKKLDTSWDYSAGSTSFNNLEKHLNGFSDAMLSENNDQRLTKLSNLVSTWSIAPPDMSLSNSSMDHYSQSFKQLPFGDSTSSSCYGHEDMKVKQEYHHHHHQASDQVQGPVLVKSLSHNTIGSYHQNGFNGLLVGDNGKFYHGVPNDLSSSTRKFSDIISFNSRLGRPTIGIHAQKPSLKYLNLSESKKQGLHTSSLTRNNGREGTAREVKKKRSEESSEAILKKSKQDASTASSTKVQAPKVKLGDKITALQQIVSPFGKTDTASVLFEAIGYIKFLQEQVQLLSSPYLKTNSHMDLWGSLDRKGHKEDSKLDLRSRGLCLVPISCTPHVYRENTGPDYWTPAYRGSLYR